MSTRRLVLLCSGWGKWDIGWQIHQRLFANRGFDVIIADYPKGLHIEYAADAIYQFLNEIALSYDHVTFVGHSMGGLIGRTLVQELECPHVDAYVSLGAPHGGSRWAVLANRWSVNARQMTPNSSFLTNLNALPWPARVPALAIQGGWEIIVWPQNHTVFRNADQNVLIDRTTHTGLLLNPAVFWEVWSWLTYDVFAEPGPMPRQGFVAKVNVLDALKALGRQIKLPGWAFPGLGDLQAS